MASPVLATSHSVNWVKRSDIDSNSAGNDGPWSVFSVGVGTPAQPVYLLVATGATQTLVVGLDGCPSSVTASVPDCSNVRGRLFDRTRSSSWHDAGIADITAQQVFGIYKQAAYGNDSLSLGGGSQTVVPNQAVGAFNAPEYWLGTLGVGVQQSNGGQASLLSSLKGQGTIPSLSYGYTAGASYRA